MKKVLVVLASVLAVVFASGVSFADDQGGFYLSLGSGLAYEQFDDADGFDIDDIKLLDFRVGYDISERLSVEAEIMNFHEFDADYHDADFCEASGHVTMLNMKYFLDIDELKPYVVFGAGFGEFTMDLLKATGVPFQYRESGTVFKGGLGFEARLSDRVMAYSEISYHKGMDGLSDYGIIPVSVGFKLKI